MSISTTKLAAGVAGGYLLGRTKKLKLAISLAGMLAGKKLAADPRSIADNILKGSPELKHLRGQLTEGLAGAARDLALATAASRMESMTQALQAPASDDESEEPEDELDDDVDEEPEDEAEDDIDEEPEDEPTPAKKSAAKRTSAKKTACLGCAHRSTSRTRWRPRRTETASLMAET